MPNWAEVSKRLKLLRELAERRDELFFCLGKHVKKKKKHFQTTWFVLRDYYQMKLNSVFRSESFTLYQDKTKQNKKR